MRANHFICPQCNHDFYDDEHLVVICDGCGKKFRVTESKTVRLPETVGQQQERLHQQIAGINRR